MNTRVPYMLVCGYDRVAGLTVDGKVLCHGSFDSSDENGECSAIRDNNGTDLTTRVFFGGSTSVTMDAHGHLFSAGRDDYGQASPVADWKGPFADIVCAFRHTIGLRQDGTVIACGWNEFGQCNVSGWRNITAVAAGLFHTLGLRQDGTVVSCGLNDEHQRDVSDWTDIVMIACNDNHSVGVKSDGTVVACGTPADGAYLVSDWNNITKVICGTHHTVGLKSDGTVVACGVNETDKNFIGGRCDVQDWTDVKDIVCSDYFTLGLRHDGTVLFTGRNTNGIVAVRKWTDIVHVACNQMAVFGIKKDGSVVTCGTGEFFSYQPVTQWKLFSSYETVDEDFNENLEQRMEAATAAKEAAAAAAAKKKTGKAVAWILIVLMLLAGALYYFLFHAPKRNDVPDDPVAYTTASSGLNMRNGPGRSYKVIATIPKGEKVTVQKTENGWAFVRYQKQEGWCSTDYLAFEK